MLILLTCLLVSHEDPNCSHYQSYTKRGDATINCPLLYFTIHRGITRTTLLEESIRNQEMVELVHPPAVRKCTVWGSENRAKILDFVDISVGGTCMVWKRDNTGKTDKDLTAGKQGLEEED